MSTQDGLTLTYRQMYTQSRKLQTSTEYLLLYTSRIEHLSHSINNADMVYRS